MILILQVGKMQGRFRGCCQVKKLLVNQSKPKEADRKPYGEQTQRSKSLLPSLALLVPILEQNLNRSQLLMSFSAECFSIPRATNPQISLELIGNDSILGRKAFLPSTNR